MTHESKLAGNKTSRGLCPKCDRKACIDCLAGQNDNIWPQNDRYPAIYGSQTIHACFAVAFRAQASTSFATGQLEVHFRLFVGTLNVNETLHWCNFRLPLEQIKLIISSCEAFSHIIILNLLK